MNVQIRTGLRTSCIRSAAISLACGLLIGGYIPHVQAAGDYGVLRLQLGTANQFAYQPDLTLNTLTEFQGITAGEKGSCLMNWASGGVNVDLARLVPYGGAGAAMPGFGYTSIGVYDGPKGTPCSRVDASTNEYLRFGLGNYTRTNIGANAFDRMEIDVEVKSDAKLLLNTYIAGSLTGTYELRTGGSIVPGEGFGPTSTGAPPEADPAHRIVNCSARSDSGPDSGPNDNCRWIINDLAQSIDIVAVNGSFSLEGGGDWAGTDAYENNTLFYLTHVLEGSFSYCSGSATLPSIGKFEDTGCTVTRTQGAANDSSCGTVNYVFRDIVGTANGCEFIKSPDSQFAASVDITFPPEPRTELNAVPGTTLGFADGLGGIVSFVPGLCTGTVVPIGGGWTISEVLTASPPPGYVDVVPGNIYADWACILEQDVDYLGPLLNPQMQVRQVILFWGDLLIIRD